MSPSPCDPDPEGAPAVLRNGLDGSNWKWPCEEGKREHLLTLGSKELTRQRVCTLVKMLTGALALLLLLKLVFS